MSSLRLRKRFAARFCSIVCLAKIRIAHEMAVKGLVIPIHWACLYESPIRVNKSCVLETTNTRWSMVNDSAGWRVNTDQSAHAPSDPNPCDHQSVADSSRYRRRIDACAVRESRLLLRKTPSAERVPAWPARHDSHFLEDGSS